MNILTAIIEADLDGTIHLPIPPGLHGGKFKVVAKIEPAGLSPGTNPAFLKGFGALKGKISMAPDFDEELADFKEYTQ